MISTFPVKLQDKVKHDLLLAEPVPEDAYPKIGLSLKGFNPWVSYRIDDETIVSADFSMHDIDSWDQWIQLEYLYTISADQYYYIRENLRDPQNENIMNDVCLRSSSSCRKGNNCVFFNSTNPFAVKCRAWLIDRSVFERDFLLRNYCNQHRLAEDCVCINRLNEPQYRMIKQNYPFNDKCWYLPCVDQNQLRLSDMTRPESEGCPQNVCQIIYNLHHNRDVLLRENTNHITCDFKGVATQTTRNGGGWLFVAVCVVLLILFLGRE